MRKRQFARLALALAAGCALWIGATVTDLAAAPAPPAQTEVSAAVLDEAVSSAAQWLVATHQNADGGFSSFSGGAGLAPSDPAGTLDALLALAAAGAEVSGPLAYLDAHGDELAAYAGQDGSTAGKAVLALLAAGGDATDAGGQNLVATISEQLEPSGAYGVAAPFAQSMAIVALAAAGERAPDSAVQWLLDRQAKEGDYIGSWDDGFGTAGNPDATAMALMALTAAGGGEASGAVERAIEYLRQAQLPSGGWEFGRGFGESANSTAVVIQALGQRGEDVVSVNGRWAPGGRSPVMALLAWQGESGALQADFGQGKQDDFFTTVQALPALSLARLQLGLGTTATDEPYPAPLDAQSEAYPAAVPSAASDSPGRGYPEAYPVTGVEPAPVGGDSALPYLLLAVLAVLLGGSLLWFWNERRR